MVKVHNLTFTTEVMLSTRLTSSCEAAKSSGLALARARIPTNAGGVGVRWPGRAADSGSGRRPPTRIESRRSTEKISMDAIDRIIVLVLYQ